MLRKKLLALSSERYRSLMVHMELITKNKILMLIVALAVIVRLIALFYLHDYPDMAGSVSVQGDVARNILHGHWFYLNLEAGEQVVRYQNERNKIVDFEDVNLTDIDNQNITRFIGNMPGYGILLAITWYVFGEMRYIYLQIVQVIMDVLIILMIYSITKRTFSEGVAKITAIMYAFFVPVVLLVITPFRNIYPLFASVAAVYLIFTLIDAPSGEKQKLKTYILLGALIGVSVWIRETMFAFPLAIGLFFAYFLGAKEAAKAFAIIAIVSVGILTPWIAVNYRDFGEFIPLSTGGGHGWYTGFGEYPNKYNITFDDSATMAHVSSEYTNVTPYSPEYDEILKKESVALIKDDPAAYASMLLKRMYRGFFLRNRPQAISTHPVYDTVRSLSLFTISALAMAGMWVSRKEDRKKILALIMVPAYFVFIYSPFNMDLRHVLAGSWVYIIFAAYFIDTAVKYVTNLRRKHSS